MKEPEKQTDAALVNWLETSCPTLVQLIVALKARDFSKPDILGACKRMGATGLMLLAIEAKLEEEELGKI